MASAVVEEARFGNLPVELVEHILSYLRGPSLIEASKVCRLWLTLCGRLIREKFQNVIPDECLVEVENPCIETAWVLALKNHYLEKYLVSNMLEHKKLFTKQVECSTESCLAVYENYLFIGRSVGEVWVYDTAGLALRLLGICSIDMGLPVVQMIVMTMQKILVVLTTGGLEFWQLKPDPRKPVSKMIPSFANGDTTKSHCNKWVSCAGNLLIVMGHHVVRVFKAHRECPDDAIIHFSLVSKYDTGTTASMASIWGDQIVILLASGEVVRWNFVNDDTTVSDVYPEIKYRNPVWIWKGRIFCSTIISSQMLGYWHMDRGAGYWLVGWPSDNLVRCRDLGTLYSADTNIENVLCVCLKQRLLACGTKDGKILLYRLSDSCFTDDKEYFDEPSNRFVRTEFQRVPDLTIRTGDRPIRELSIVYREHCIHIYSWPYMTLSGPGSKGPLHCYSLQTADWITVADKDKMS